MHLCKVEELAQEIARLQKDHLAIKSSQKDLEASRRRLDQERSAWEKKKVYKVNHTVALEGGEHTFVGIKGCPSDSFHVIPLG